MRYQENHIKTFSHDEPSKAARTVVAITIASMMGVPVFFVGLFHYFSLKNILSENKHKVFALFHQNGNVAFLLMCDNLKENQTCSNLYKEQFGSSVIFSCKHPLENEEFESFHLFFDLLIFQKLLTITAN